MMEWQEAVEYLMPYVVKISTPRGSGSGFLLWYSSQHPFCSVATAAHVIDHAHYWEQPIRLEHSSGTSLMVHHGERAVFLDEAKDTAVLFFDRRELPKPSMSPPELTPEGRWLKTGIEVGWVGYPSVSPQTLCFFSGRVSAYLNDQNAYLIDGVSINGVSGGPTFFLRGDGAVVIGVVSAYMPNRATGDVLPGVAVVRDVTQFLEHVKTFKSLGEAKDEETPATEPPPQPEQPSA